MVAWLALFVSVLALLTVRELEVAWRRVLGIGTIAGVLAGVSIVGLAVQNYVLPHTERYLFIPDGMLWPFLIVLFALAPVLALRESIINRRKRKELRRNSDPGDYKINWQEKGDG